MAAHPARLARNLLSIAGLWLSACVADPAPLPCAVNANCPRDVPWCMAGACALRPDAPIRTDGAPTPSAAVPACAEADGRRCEPVCDWLVACLQADCSRVVAGMPELVDEVRESCASQCRVDAFVGDELCRLSVDGGCAAVIDDMRRLLGFGLCR